MQTYHFYEVVGNEKCDPFRKEEHKKCISAARLNVNIIYTSMATHHTSAWRDLNIEPTRNVASLSWRLQLEPAFIKTLLFFKIWSAYIGRVEALYEPLTWRVRSVFWMTRLTDAFPLPIISRTDE